VGGGGGGKWGWGTRQSHRYLELRFSGLPESVSVGELASASEHDQQMNVRSAP
jgi:hypothetical protein